MPKIKSIEARLEVADVVRSAAFYEDVLGFSTAVLWPDKAPQFAMLNRDGLRLQLAKNTDGSASTAATSSIWQQHRLGTFFVPFAGGV